MGPWGERAGLGRLCHSVFSTTAPDYDRSQWLSEKFKLGLDFPNVGGRVCTVGLSEASVYSAIPFPSSDRGFGIRGLCSASQLPGPFTAFPPCSVFQLIL